TRTTRTTRTTRMTRISQPQPPPAETRDRGAAETDAPAALEAAAPATAALAVSAADMDAIGRHAVRTYPEECCGFLLGEERGGTTRVDRVVPAANERQDSRHNRFVMSPETVLAAHKEARAAGLSVVGYYHSHPDHPAEPSQFDREHAWPGLSYLIVSVCRGQVDRARSWRLRDDRERFAEEYLASASEHPV
ncbi:MAG TPA: M67 family metallopeptidase, partial [Thermoanaerobaculia bacterium]|nr:M67 family metallopeptidase [Thermoanaerobaculia bacterium]